MKLSYLWAVVTIGSTVPLLATSGASAAEPEKAALHRIELSQPVLYPEEGLLLGNGDLSVSIYQMGDKIVWRFGKGDVWDRRLDLSDDPKPAHIDEIAKGIREEGWKCGPYGGPVEASRGTKNPKRMQELCQGCPPSYTKRPYPCPKPVGELALHLPSDLPGLSVHQTLTIEEGVVRITCSWPSGVKIHLESFVPPTPNVLVVNWRVENWNEQTKIGLRPPVWFSLYRWADPTVQAFGARFFGDARHSAFLDCASPKATPLPAPTTRLENGGWVVEQTFPADPLFPKGFRYQMAPFVPQVGIEPANMEATGEARLHILPGQAAAAPGSFQDANRVVPNEFASQGSLAVAVATSSDAGGPSAEIQRVRTQLAAKPELAFAKWAEENRKSATEFWAHSSLRIADPLLENLWYETLHARRCAYRRGTVPPGLFLPSTVQDYSHWHGDYHLNYNFQEPFFGDYTANHLELGDAYFDGMQFLLPIGRKIAKDYYGCRGVFIQLSMYPIQAEDDPLGVAPMGRMAYMTGWAVNQYWWRYLYTRDVEWLRATGYPVLRDAALFYTDFFKKGADGLYHAFPSNQGEDGFTGKAKDYTDRTQIMQHARYCFRAAIGAAEVLNVDADLRKAWQDRLDHAAGDDGAAPVKLNGIEKICYEANAPEFAIGRPYRAQPDHFEKSPAPPSGWYFGQYPWVVMRQLRGGEFVAGRDLPAFRTMVERWRRPNGLIWAMAVAGYGRAGAWTESLGVTGPLQEMMLQSWDGALRIFPAWPKNLDARFEKFRAEGAFLVTAAWSAGQVTSLEIVSEKGSPCRLYPPWPSGANVTEAGGQAVSLTPIGDDRVEFATRPGVRYILARK